MHSLQTLYEVFLVGSVSFIDVIHYIKNFVDVHTFVIHGSEELLDCCVHTFVYSLKVISLFQKLFSMVIRNLGACCTGPWSTRVHISTWVGYICMMLSIALYMLSIARWLGRMLS